MAYISDETYYQDSDNWGSYQFVPIREFVDAFLITRVGPDKEVDNVRFHEVMFHAKQGIKEFGFDSAKSMSVIEISLDSDLKVILPPDYVDYVRISVNNQGILTTLRESRKAATATKYLQEANGDVVFDINGNVVTEQSLLDQTRIAGTLYSGAGMYNGCCGWEIDGNWYFSYKINPYNENVLAGTFEVDSNTGVINFSSEFSGSIVVIEYVSDSMKAGNDAEIGIHKMAEEWLYAYVKAEILRHKLGIPEYVKKRSAKDAKALWNNAKIRIGGLSAGRLITILRGR